MNTNKRYQWSKGGVYKRMSYDLGLDEERGADSVTFDRDRGEGIQRRQVYVIPLRLACDREESKGVRWGGQGEKGCGGVLSSRVGIVKLIDSVCVGVDCGWGGARVLEMSVWGGYRGWAGGMKKLDRLRNMSMTAAGGTKKKDVVDFRGISEKEIK